MPIQSTPNTVLTSKAYGEESTHLEDLIRTECDPRNDNDCGMNAKCELSYTKTALGFVCQCDKGYHHVDGVTGCVGM